MIRLKFVEQFAGNETIFFVAIAKKKQQIYLKYYFMMSFPNRFASYWNLSVVRNIAISWLPTSENELNFRYNRTHTNV